MTKKPVLARSMLHPGSNKAAAMSPTGDWFSYSEVPTIEEGRWAKPKPDTLCFRIPEWRAPEWEGTWQESLIVFEDEAH